MRHSAWVGHWRDDKQRGNDVVGDEIVQQFGGTALLVSVLTPRCLASDGWRRELLAFCDQARRSCARAPGNKARAFKVVKTPVADQATLPAQVRDTRRHAKLLLHPKPEMANPAPGATQGAHPGSVAATALPAGAAAPGHRPLGRWWPVAKGACEAHNRPWADRWRGLRPIGLLRSGCRASGAPTRWWDEAQNLPAKAWPLVPRRWPGRPRPSRWVCAGGPAGPPRAAGAAHPG